MDPSDLEKKARRLKKILGGYGTLLVAFSGGVDSTLLLAVASNVLKEKVVAVTYASPFHSQREIREAIDTADALGAVHKLLKTDVTFAKKTSRKSCGKLPMS